MDRLRKLLVNEDGSLSGTFYVLAYFVLTHVFFWKLLVPGQMVFGTDIQNQSYPIQHFAVGQMTASGSMMLWNPYIFSGMPFLASFSFPFFYPGALLFFILPVGFAMGYEVVLHFFFMGVFMYAFLRHLGISRQAAFLGGLVFMFNAHYVSLVYPGHGGKIFTMTFLPLALMFLSRAFRSEPLFNFTMMGLLVGLMFYGGHPQILFYCGIALSVYFVVLAAAGFGELKAVGVLKLFGYFAGSFAVGTLLYAVILFPAMEYRNFTNRAGGMAGASSYEYASSFSQPPEDMLYVPLRNPFGWGKDYGAKVPTTDGIFYRGRIGLRLSVDYAGVFALVLALIGAAFARNRHTWYFVILAVLASFLALGRFNPAYYYVYKYVPGFSLFRVPYAIMILLPVCWGGLAAFGLQGLMDMDVKKTGRIKRVVWVVAALAAVSLSVALYWNSAPMKAINWLLGFNWVRQMLWGFYGDVEERFAFFVQNLFAFSALAAFSGLVLFSYIKGWLTKKQLAAAAVVFVLLDLWPVGWEFIKTVPTDKVESTFFPETPAIKRVKQEGRDDFRVFSMVTNNELLYYGVQSLTGYHAVILGYYESALRRMDYAGPLPDLLNAKYLMLPKKPENDFANMKDESVREILARKYVTIEDPEIYFYENKEVLPRAYLVNTIWVARDDNQALGVVTDRRFRPDMAAVISREPKFDVDPKADLSGQKTEMTVFTPDRVAFEVDAPAASFLVVSEIWYPGWKAYVDGVEAEIYRTDYLLRGVPMPAGRHTVEMVFDPPLFKLGAVVSAATLAFVIAMLAIHFRRKRDTGAHSGEETSSE